MSKKACVVLVVLGVVLCLGARWLGAMMAVITGIGEDLNPFVYLLGLVFVFAGSLGAMNQGFRDGVWQLLEHFNTWIVMLAIGHLGIRLLMESGLSFRNGIREAVVAGICWVIGYSILWIGWPDYDDKAKESQLVTTGRAIFITLGVMCLTGACLFWGSPAVGWYGRVALISGGLALLGGGIFNMFEPPLSRIPPPQ